MDSLTENVIQTADVFQTSSVAHGMYEEIFWGLFSRVGLAELLQIGFLVSLLLSILSLFLYGLTDKKRYSGMFLVSLVLQFSCMNILINQPWDELFIFLRHSQHLSESNIFSFNRFEAIEGIVDFLPYFLIGLLGKVGFGLVEMALLLSYLGGLACLFLVWKIVTKFNIRGARGLGIVLLSSFFPPLCFNSAQGFSTTIFCFFVLETLYLCWYQKPTKSAWALLSLVPLIRLEGALWVFLLWLTCMLKEKAKIKSGEFWKKYLTIAVGINIPLLILTLYRWVEYGHLVPTPVTYKASFGNLHYLKLGVRTFLKDSLSSMVFVCLSVVTFVVLLLWENKDNDNKEDISKFIAKVIYPLGLLFLFVLPYYFSGGDWFPHTWARYQLPFSLFLFVMAFVCFHYVSIYLSGRARVFASSAMILLLSTYFLQPLGNGFIVLKNDLFGKNAAKGTYRLEQLSRIGKHLEETLRPSDVIASGEVATIMYYANKEAIDLLGVTNPDIASTPLLENNNPAFRRIKPSLINEKNPAVLWAYDFVEVFESSLSDQKLMDELNRNERVFAPPSLERFGGVRNLIALQYRTVVVEYGGGFNTVYWVSKDAWPFHKEALLRKGFRYRSISQQPRATPLS